ncbi:MAG: histidine phosphatase family protein [Cyanobium sp.]|nr:MAG: histidine phosphatase family protein [Cyanobium sp.]
MHPVNTSIALFLGLGIVGAVTPVFSATMRVPVEPASFGSGAIVGLPVESDGWLLSQGGEGGEAAGKVEEMSAGEKANAAFVNRLGSQQLLAALRSGGNIIYFRHAQTTKDYADQADPKMSLASCETQRKLSAAGIEQSREIGKAFQTLKIPVGTVHSSQYCRAWQTADLAFGRHQQSAKLNFLPFEDYTDAQMAEMKANLLPFLTAPPRPGTNTVVVGHDDLFEAATGIYPDPQGIAYVLTPDGKGGFTVQASLKPDQWASL